MAGNKKGYSLDKGFLFDYEWLPMFKTLTPKEAWSLLVELMEYQRSGGSAEISKHPKRPAVDLMTATIVYQIDRRLKGVKAPIGTDQKSSEVPTIVPTTLKKKREREEEGEVEGEVEEREGEEKGEDVNAAEQAAALSHAPKAEEVKKYYGEFENVLLTNSEKTALSVRFGAMAETLINTFSRKLKAKGYKYADHYAAILLWAEKDGVEDSNAEKSYDTDAFFEAAISRSYADMMEGGAEK